MENCTRSHIHLYGIWQIGVSVGLDGAMSLSERTNNLPAVQSHFTLQSYVLSRTYVAILILSMCVVLQVLGTPVGLIDLLTPNTSAESSHSEGFSIPTEPSEVWRPTNPRFFIKAPPLLYHILLIDLMFRPPQ
jgi:hypothetical protein